MDGRVLEGAVAQPAQLVRMPLSPLTAPPLCCCAAPVHGASGQAYAVSRSGRQLGALLWCGAAAWPPRPRCLPSLFADPLRLPPPRPLGPRGTRWLQ
jgi:hypothetical protein